MKTAISIPDEIFRRVTRGARELGISRSEFFMRAVVAYLDELDSKSLTAQINAALDLIGEEEDSQLVVEASKRRLRERDDEW